VEVHLPSRVPLSLLEKIVMPHRMYATLLPKLRNFSIGQGRTLADIVVLVKDEKESERWQKEYFAGKHA
jgi:hypothetical protein